MQRSKLHSTSVMNWLKSRHLSTSSENYRLFPEERKRQKELEQLFSKFDTDGSDALDFDEVFAMFHQYGFFISRNELRQYFEIVDINKDFSLNLQEFKACMLDERAKELFARIMKKLASRTNITSTIEQAALDEMNKLIFEDDEFRSRQKSITSRASFPNPVIPLTFQKIINMMTYLSTREEIKKVLVSKAPIKDQCKCLEDLLKLSYRIDVDQQKPPVVKKFKPPQKIKKNENQEIDEQILKIKRQSIQRGLQEAEAQLRKKNSAALIMIEKPREYKYASAARVTRKFTKLQEPYRDPNAHSDNRVNQFYKYMNISVPDDLKNINTKIWNKLFEDKEQLDQVLLRKNQNQLQTERSDRLRCQIQQSMHKLQVNIDPCFDKKPIEMSTSGQQFLPTMPTSRHQFTTSDEFYKSR